MHSFNVTVHNVNLPMIMLQDSVTVTEAWRRNKSMVMSSDVISVTKTKEKRKLRSTSVVMIQWRNSGVMLKP